MNKSSKFLCFALLPYWSFSDTIFDKCLISDGLTVFCWPPPPWRPNTVKRQKSCLEMLPNRGYESFTNTKLHDKIAIATVANDFKSQKCDFFFRKIIQIIQKNWVINTGTISSLEWEDVCTLVVRFPHLLVILAQFSTHCSLVTMVTQGLRVLFFEVSCQGLLKNSFSSKSEKSWKTTWATTITKLVLIKWKGASKSFITESKTTVL